MSFYVSLPKNNITAYAIPVSTTNNSPSKCSEPKMHCFTKCQTIALRGFDHQLPVDNMKMKFKYLTMRHRPTFENPKSQIRAQSCVLCIFVYRSESTRSDPSRIRPRLSGSADNPHSGCQNLTLTFMTLLT